MNYPVDRMTYNKFVGTVRVDNILTILIELDFKVKAEKVEEHDVDIWAYDESGNLLLVIEVTNWHIYSYMSMIKAKSIQDNFRKYSCCKLLILSFENNYAIRRNYIDSDVDVLFFGFQTQPFYDFFSKRRSTKGMRPDDEETLEIEKRHILGYLVRKGLI